MVGHGKSVPRCATLCHDTDETESVLAQAYRCFRALGAVVETAYPDGLAMAMLRMRGDFADFDAVDRGSAAAGHLGSKGLERG